MPAVESARSPVTWLVTAWTRPLWWVVQATAAAPYTRRDAERWAQCLTGPGLERLPEARASAGWSPVIWSSARWCTTGSPRCRGGPAAAAGGLPPASLAAPELRGDRAGLFIEHGFSTTLTARTVGRDCRVNQQVTVGHTGRGQPVIGDRVSIGAGAVVVGPVPVGDDTCIGANATVVRDVPPGAVVLAPAAVAR